MNDDKEKDTLTGQGVCVSESADKSALSNTCVDISIPQVPATNQEQKPKMGGKELKLLSIEKKVCNFALKCYLEQLPLGLAYTIYAICQMDKRVYQIIGILHDLDEVSDGLWAVALEKPHFHLIFRHVDRKRSTRISAILKELGIVFRPGIDDNLLQNRGLETVGNFASYATYLTHETEDAIRDAKEIYPMDKLVSNLTEEEVLQVRDGYVRVSEKRKITQDELVALDKEAYDLGYRLKGFSKWYDSQPFCIRSNSKLKVIRESYYRGVNAVLEEDRKVTRLCIFIRGRGNTGKTYASGEAMSGRSIKYITGGGSGVFDDLRPDHEVLIFDDSLCPNLINMADNNICTVYRRNNNNPVWAGDTLIITHNEHFDRYAELSGVPVYDGRSGITTDTYEALLTRFFMCQLVETDGVKHLALLSPSTRGTKAEQQNRLDRFLKFQKGFDATIKDYVPELDGADYSGVVEKLPPPAGAQVVSFPVDKAIKPVFHSEFC